MYPTKYQQTVNTQLSAYDTSLANTLKSAIEGFYTTSWNDLKSAYDEMLWYVENVRDVERQSKVVYDCTEPIPTWTADIGTAETAFDGFYQRQLDLVVDSYYTYWTNADTSNTGGGIDDSADAARLSSIFTVEAINSFSTDTNLANFSDRSQWDIRALQDADVAASTSHPQVESSRSDYVVFDAIDNYVANPLTVLRQDVSFRPTSITTCVGSDNRLTGFQVWISTVSPIAGASHGDLSTTCTRTAIDGAVVQVDFF